MFTSPSRARRAAGDGLREDDPLLLRGGDAERRRRAAGDGLREDDLLLLRGGDAERRRRCLEDLAPRFLGCNGGIDTLNGFTLIPP